MDAKQTGAKNVSRSVNNMSKKLFKVKLIVTETGKELEDQVNEFCQSVFVEDVKFCSGDKWYNALIIYSELKV